MDNKIDRCAKRQKTAALKDKRQNIIRIIILVFIPLSLFLCPSCKENKWLDWKTQNEMWLEHNKTQPGVVTTSSGLQYRIIADPGAKYGETKPNQTSTIICDYKLSLINGNVLDYQGPSFGGILSKTFNLANTIPGFAEGCHHIHTHGDIELFIPATLGYDYEKYNNDKYSEAEGLGTEGSTSYIPPYSTLIYTVHLCSVVGE